jgi:hypothetical protein
MLEFLREQDRAFFESEGLTEFLNLDWGMEVDECLVVQFIKSYDSSSCKVSIAGEEIVINEELILEVFRLPRGDYKMPQEIKSSALRVGKTAPYFTAEEPRRDFMLPSCNDPVWRNRLHFFQQFILLRPQDMVVPYCFICFLQAEGKVRNWFDVFMRYFYAEITRCQSKLKDPPVIESHVTLLLAHIKNKKLLLAGVSTPHVQTGNDKYEAGETLVQAEQALDVSLTISSMGDQILRHHDIQHQRINKLLNRLAALRSEAELWTKSNVANLIADLRTTNANLEGALECSKSEEKSRKSEVDKLKTELRIAEESREELEAIVASFLTKVKSRKCPRPCELTLPSSSPQNKKSKASRIVPLSPTERKPPNFPRP